MDLYPQVLACASRLPLVAGWTEMQALLQRATAKRDRNWLLPCVGCQAVGGTSEQAVAAMAAVACLQISIILIDDLLDDDPRGEYRRIGPGPAANLGLGFMAAGLAALSSGPAEPAARAAAQQVLSAMMGQTAFGQHLGLGHPNDEDDYWRVVQAKSRPFFGAALEVGALLGNASPALAAKVGRLGGVYGEIVQVYDDLKDTLAVPANADWRMGRSPLPILYARQVAHPDQAHFAALCQTLAEPGEHSQALAEAQAILVRSGAVSYGVYAILERATTARAALTQLPVAAPAPLAALLDDQLKPVRQLLQSLPAEAANPTRSAAAA